MVRIVCEIVVSVFRFLLVVLFVLSFLFEVIVVLINVDCMGMFVMDVCVGLVDLF